MYTHVIGFLPEGGLHATGRLDYCDRRGDPKTDQFCSEENVRARSSPNVASEGHAGTFVSLHLAADQQITDRGLLSSGIQGSFSPAAVEESWARCR